MEARERLLTRHFLERFVENDLVSPEADRHGAMSFVAGALMAVGLFVSTLSAIKFLFMVFQSPGRTALAALDDRLLFISMSMLVPALVAVAAWEALSLDARDAAVLGVLPVRHAAIVRAKLRAVALLAGGCALAIAVVPSLIHPTLMINDLRIGVAAAATLVIVQLGVALAAGLFGFACVLAVREMSRAILGRTFARLSPLIQALSIVALVSTLLLLPMLSNDVPRQVRRAAHSALPPFWFLGVQEALAGALVADAVPPVLPEWLREREAAALARYRETAAVLVRLGPHAVLALTGAAALALVASFWNARRLPLPPTGSRRAPHRRSHGAGRWTAPILARSPAARAAFSLTRVCAWRSAPHRVVLAACTALAVALAAVLLGGSAAVPAEALAAAPLSVFATQTLVLIVLLAGYRHILRIPADVRANRLFRLAWLGQPRDFVRGVKYAGILTVAVPALLVLLPVHVRLLGTTTALMHLTTGLLFAGAFLAGALFRPRQLPLNGSYTPSGAVNTLGPVVFVGGMLAVGIFARIERIALTSASGALMLWAVLGGTAIILHVAGRRSGIPDEWLLLEAPPASATHLELG